MKCVFAELIDTIIDMSMLDNEHVAGLAPKYITTKEVKYEFEK